MSKKETDHEETLNEVNGLEKTSSETLGGQEVKYKYQVLENADLFYKKLINEVRKMENGDIMTKKEIYHFIENTYNNL
jgi:hypothetical protein